MGRERQRQPPKCHVKLLFTTTGNSFVLYFSSLVFFFFCILVCFFFIFVFLASTWASVFFIGRQRSILLIKKISRSCHDKMSPEFRISEVLITEFISFFFFWVGRDLAKSHFWHFPTIPFDSIGQINPIPVRIYIYICICFYDILINIFVTRWRRRRRRFSGHKDRKKGVGWKINKQRHTWC